MFKDRTTGGRRTAPATAVRAVGAMLLVAGMCAPAVIANAATPTEPGASGIAQQCQEGWQQLEGGDGRRFVDVGSCVSYAARGGVLVPRNQAPVAVDDTARVGSNVGGVVEVLANDTDADGDVLSVTVAGPPANGTTSVGPTGDVEYVPSLNFSGEDSFTYTVDDGRGGTDTATVHVTVVAAPLQIRTLAPPSIFNDITIEVTIVVSPYDPTTHHVVAVTFTGDDGTTVSIPPDKTTINTRVPVTIPRLVLPAGTYDVGVVMNDGELTTAAVLPDSLVVDVYPQAATTVGSSSAPAG